MRNLVTSSGSESDPDKTILDYEPVADSAALINTGTRSGSTSRQSASQSNRSNYDTYQSRADKVIPKKQATLFVYPNPVSAKVRIFNIGPVFEQGMKLDPGKYHVEVSKTGYKTRKQWVELTADQSRSLRVELEKNPASIEKNIATGDTWCDPTTGMEMVWVSGAVAAGSLPRTARARLAATVVRRALASAPLGSGWFSQDGGSRSAGKRASRNKVTQQQPRVPAGGPCTALL